MPFAVYFINAHTALIFFTSLSFLFELPVPMRRLITDVVLVIHVLQPIILLLHLFWTMQVRF